VNEEQFKQYVSATQDMLGQLNERLSEIRDAVERNAKVQAGALTLAACAQDASQLAVRALAETNVEFRTIMLRLAQEPASIPAAQESRNILAAALAEHQRIAGERPSLKPVPPSGAKT
jgi:hypothetical protein